MNGWEGMLLGEAGGRYYISIYLTLFKLIGILYFDNKMDWFDGL